MRLTRLRIQQLPGIDGGFTLEKLDAGINLITGPNAVGKSSLIRALRYLVSEPESDDPPALALDADFENGGHWRVSRTGRGYEWRRDNESAERPALPDRDSLHCYWLTMENLVQVGEDDEKLVAQLRQALTGGYDLPALRGGEFEVRPRVGNTEGKRLREAVRKQRRVESEYRELRRREATLEDLQARISQATSESARAASLKEALKLIAILTERKLSQVALDEFPTHMVNLHGNELDRLDQLERQLAQRKRESEAVERSRQDAEAVLQRTGLSDVRPQERELQARRQVLAEIDHSCEKLNDKREKRSRALAEETLALQSLGGSDKPPYLELDAIKRAENLAAELNRIRLQRDETEARIQNVADAPEERTLIRYRLAIQALLDWLAAGQEGRKKTGFIWTGIGGAVAVGAAAFRGAWIALAAAVVVMGVSIWSFIRKSDDGTAQALSAFERQTLDGPSEWRRAPVEKALQELQQRFDELRLEQHQALVADEYRERLLQLEKKLAEKDREKRELAEEIGFDPSLTALGVDHFVRHVQEYQRAVQERQAIDESISRLGQEITDARDGVRNFLSRWGVTVEATQSELDATLGDLAGRTHRAEEAVATRDRMTTELNRLRQEIEEQEQQITALYREAGLAPGDRTGLEVGIDRLDAWKAQRKRLQGNELRESECRESLEGQPSLIEQAERGAKEDLERECDKAESEAAGLEDLRNERAQINADIRAAGGDRQLEKAGAEVDEAMAELEDRMNEQLFAETGEFLLDQVEEEHRTEHEPKVLRDARDRFQRFTQYAWDLELSGDRLRARDRKQNSLRELLELSSGTRMQLLLAVRLAWTRHLERKLEPLPLFLDEALTTADENRFKAVAESLESLARDEGRQIFYLSARQHEVALWEGVTGNRPNHIELADVRSIREEPAPEDYDLPEEELIPEPEDKSAEEYAAELHVPSVEPSRSATAIHLFHLLRDDLSLVYHLIRDWKVTTLGQLEALLESPAARTAIPDERQRAILQDRCRIAQAWARVWRWGRDKPVDRIALEESGAVSGHFIEEVTALANEHGGEAEFIIEALENKAVSGFRAKKVEELQEYMQQNGYLNGDEPLDALGREQKTLLAVGQLAKAEEIHQVFRWLESALRK